MARRAKVWKVREDYRPLLKRVKNLFPTLLAHVKTKKIGLVGIYAKNCGWMGRIYPNRYPWCLFLPDYDYIIAFHSSKFDEKPKSYRLWVMRHELAHVPREGHLKGSRGYRKTVKHDIEDFKLLRMVYGLNLENVKKIYDGERAELDYDTTKSKARKAKD